MYGTMAHYRTVAPHPAGCVMGHRERVAAMTRAIKRGSIAGATGVPREANPYRRSMTGDSVSWHAWDHHWHNPCPIALREWADEQEAK